MMNKLKTVLALVFLVVIFGSCKKKIDDFYKAPEDLSPPIYEQLKSKGYFTKFLSLIDKAGYKQILSTSGYWTMFAPTDTAFDTDTEFKALLASRGISNVEAIDSASATAIVQYLLVFNGFNKDRLDDYQQTNPAGFVPNSAFKRRTAFYTGFYNDTLPSGQVVKAIASNRNGGYVITDNNNKYIPFFTNDFFTNTKLPTSDYNFFYPGTPFTGFNVVNSKVTQQDIAAGNGVIHVIDHVVTPLLSIDQYIRTRPEYSDFRNLFEKTVNLQLVQFIQNADATHRYQVLTGSTENVYVKTYSTVLAYSPNNENYFRLQENDAQRDGWTMMVPTNAALQAYLKIILAEGYLTLNNLPLNVMADLLNSHMWQYTLWPSRFGTTFNFLGESSHIGLNTVIDKKILSNGFFYGTNAVNEPNRFSTVYGKAYLNPKFSIMNRLLDQNDDVRTAISSLGTKYALLMIPDVAFRARGYDFNTSTGLYSFNGVAHDSNRLNLLRIINTAVIATPNGELDNVAPTGYTGAGLAASYGGEVIKYIGTGTQTTIQTAGTNERGITVRVDSVKTAKNGRAIYVNDLLYFPSAAITLDSTLKRLAIAPASDYSIFYNYLINSSAYDPATKTTVGIAVGSFYTLFVPNNNAMRTAITAGLLPGTATTPNYTPTITADKAKVEKFIFYHFIDKRTIIPDMKDIGLFPTFLRSTVTGDPLFLNIQYPGGLFEISDEVNRKSHIVPPISNNSTLSQRSVIYLIDNYLKYQ